MTQPQDPDVRRAGQNSSGRIVDAVGPDHIVLRAQDVPDDKGG